MSLDLRDTGWVLHVFCLTSSARSMPPCALLSSRDIRLNHRNTGGTNNRQSDQWGKRVRDDNNLTSGSARHRKGSCFFDIALVRIPPRLDACFIYRQYDVGGGFGMQVVWTSRRNFTSHEGQNHIVVKHNIVIFFRTYPRGAHSENDDNSIRDERLKC